MFFKIKKCICWWVNCTYDKMHGAKIKKKNFNFMHTDFNISEATFLELTTDIYNSDTWLKMLNCIDMAKCVHVNVTKVHGISCSSVTGPLAKLGYTIMALFYLPHIFSCSKLSSSLSQTLWLFPNCLLPLSFELYRFNRRLRRCTRRPL